MFACRACTRRTVRALLGSRPADIQTASLRTTAVSLSRQQTYATAPAGVQSADSAALVDSSAKSERSPKKLQWIANKHLQYLDDPYNIADHVLKILERDQYDEALVLTQEASKDKKVVVSWNHLINYQLRNQRLHAAVKLYNEMKKRAQLPNAQTYTILFRGFAASRHPKLAASEAFRIYQNMLNSDRLKPNTIHMNSVLEVCSRAGDIDLLFTVVNTANQVLRAPDNRTYTIILNALRHQVEPFAQRRGLEDVQHQKNVETSIQRAKSIWQEVVRRWRKDQIVIDEPLVCAMGRILLQGDHNDRNSVLALLEQTMNLPAFREANTDLMAGWFSQEAGSTGAAAEGKTVAAVPETQKSSRTRASNHAVPTQNTLSLVMSTLRSIKRTTLAPRYWDYLTTTYHIRADTENFTRYLKALQLGNASTKTAELVPTIPQNVMAPKFFRISLQTCINDNLNQHAFKNACRIFDTMTQTMRYPDAESMRLFLHGARANYRQFQQQRGVDPVGSKMALGKQIVAALDRMWEPFRILSTSFSYPTQRTQSPEGEWNASINDRWEVVAVARRMMAAIDTVVLENMADPPVLKVLKTRNTIIRQYVSRFNEKNNQMNKKIQEKSAEQEQPESDASASS